MSNPIGWCDKTWNPLVGCSPISEGCSHCWAQRMAVRAYSKRPGCEHLINAGKWTGKVRCFPERLDWPLHRRKPLKIAVGLMSDLFHEQVPDEFIDKVFAMMACCPQHRFQCLSKRPQRMQEYIKKAVGRVADLIIDMRRESGFDDPVKPCSWFGGPGHYWWPLPNIWLGVSCENQDAADERIPLLLRTPAAKRFVSLEPMLGPIDIRQYLGCPDKACCPEEYEHLVWAVAGCESGPGARPCKYEWIESIVDQCHAAGVPVWVKQINLNGRVNRNINQWPATVQFREFPNTV